MLDAYYSMFPEKKEYYDGMTMLHRAGEPVEVADVVVFYLSSKASCTCFYFNAEACAILRLTIDTDVTGSEIMVDGGWTSW